MNTIKFLLPALIFITAGCNNGEKKPVTKEVNDDSIVIAPPAVINKDSLLLATGRNILSLLKNKDYQGISHYWAPGDSVHFSPYGFIGSGEQTITAKGWLLLLSNNAKQNWGSYDGSGDPINLTAKQYIEKFIYNADFLNAEKTTIDSFIKTGNSLNNLKQAFPNTRFIEYHFPGFDKKYGGMDWTSLRLVFKELDNKYFLVAIVHDQWTI